jgi:hypothetical protein
MSAILTYLWVQCYKTDGLGEILDRFWRGVVLNLAEDSRTGGESRELVYRAMVARQVANILDFRIPQKHVGRDKLAW